MDFSFKSLGILNTSRGLNSNDFLSHEDFLEYEKLTQT